MSGAQIYDLIKVLIIMTWSFGVLLNKTLCSSVASACKLKLIST